MGTSEFRTITAHPPLSSHPAGETRQAGSSFTSQTTRRQTVRELARRTPQTLRPSRSIPPISFIQTGIEQAGCGRNDLRSFPRTTVGQVLIDPAYIPRVSERSINSIILVTSRVRSCDFVDVYPEHVGGESGGARGPGPSRRFADRLHCGSAPAQSARVFATIARETLVAGVGFEPTWAEPTVTDRRVPNGGGPLFAGLEASRVIL